MSNYEMKEKSMVDMFVTIEGDEWKDAVSKAFDRLAKNVEIDGLIFMYKKQKLHLYLIESKNKKKRAHNDAKDDLDIKLDKLGLDDKLNEIKQEYNPKGIYYHLII